MRFLTSLHGCGYRCIIPAVVWTWFRCLATNLQLWQLQHLAVMWSSFANYTAGFQLAKSLGKPAEGCKQWSWDHRMLQLHGIHLMTVCHNLHCKLVQSCEVTLYDHVNQQWSRWSQVTTAKQRLPVNCSARLSKFCWFIWSADKIAIFTVYLACLKREA